MIQDKIGMFGFLTHWIIETWNGVNKYRFEQDIQFPTKIDFYKALVSKSKKIKIGRGLSLHNVLYRMGSLNRSYYIERDHKNCMFVILPYIDHEETEDGFDGYLVHLNSIEDTEIKKFVCSKERWDIVVDYRNLNQHCWVGGWVKNTGENTPPEFIDIAIVPSNSHGLWSESSYEIKFYDLLCKIWGDDGGGCQGSDYVDDTPNQAKQNYGTPTYPHISCDNGPHGDMFMNYMDYVNDETMFMFTAGQVARMDACLLGPRSSFLENNPSQ
ncbi:hypothetical protein DX928_23535 [Bacillus swezeyi]|uniref:Peptidase M43 pregnancy-associated plasma-A domain-containing protein n=2 Tax=Bacillus swezeyi TaxID=1925020 RepID=A0A5M8RIW6_9BACI|nr:hypothetical protein DX927_23295 [Bacillus swezeyi]KAA6471581.1 hypothetical protein DX928_23535 [Bacillus swezeyi]